MISLELRIEELIRMILQKEVTSFTLSYKDGNLVSIIFETPQRVKFKITLEYDAEGNLTKIYSENVSIVGEFR